LIELLGDERDVALVALGSFGRGDMAPFSDVDLMLLHKGRRDVASVAERIWYPIWDRGLRLDHSVRTVREALVVASHDLKAALGLLDARLVAGSAGLVDDLSVRLLAQWRKRSSRVLPELRRLSSERWGRFGDVAYELEPDLKDGRGGLRDIYVARAVTLAVPAVGAPDLGGAHAVLSRVRSCLHERAGRAQDRLLLQEQDSVAEALGFGDADELLRSVSSAAATVSYLGDECWRRALALPRGRVVSADRDLGRGVMLRDGEVDASKTDALTLTHAAAAAAEIGAPLAAAYLDRVGSEMSPPPQPWPAELLRSFVALLGAGRSALPVLESLDHHRLLVRLLPEWEAVRHKPQRNAYHRFTVDRHLLEAVAEAARLTPDVSRPDLLLLGTLLHDLGKGFPGDHSAVGVELVRRIGPRIGLPPADANVLERLVRHHLLLPDTATRRDLSDPRTVELVADAVGDRATLHLLAALTEADSRATGPAAWSEWKAGLMADLVRRVESYLGGAPAPEPDPVPVPSGAVNGSLYLEVDGRRVTVVAADRRGLFSTVAGVFALHGLEVLSAEVSPAPDGRAVERFEVEQAVGDGVDWDRIRDDVAAALDGRLVLADELAERSRRYATRYRPSGPAVEPRVIVDQHASARSTVVEVRAADALGLLHRVTRTITRLGFDIRFARVSTIGHQVVDAFYLDRVEDEEALDALERALLRELR
jgi:[protein-PII] uridylyltransferase